MRSMKRQEGVTAIGWLIILGLIGFFVLLTLKMVPTYMEYYKIVSTLESLEEESALDTRGIRDLIERRFDISYVSTISHKDVRIQSAGKFYRVTAKYDAIEHLFGNVSVLMKFEKQVMVNKR